MTRITILSRIDDAAILALKKKNCRVHIFAISDLIDIANARRGTSSDLILKARSGPVLEVTVLALPDQKKFL